MASGKIFKIGKMLISVSGKGIATKDTTTGEIRRMRFPWAQPKPVQPDENDREAYDDDQYADDQDNQYNDQDYDDQEQNYSDDDRDYPNEDYDDEGSEENGGLLNATWFMWAMLILLPPFGIWLLWRRNRYEFTTRTALSLVFIVWFILLLVLLFTRMGGRDNTVRPDTSTAPSVSATATVTPTPTITPTPTPNAAEVSSDPSVTPNAEGTSTPTTTDSTSTSSTQFVYSVQGGTYFHSNPDCGNMTGASRVTLSVALARNQTACPKCYQQPTATPAATNTPLPSGSYYATPTGECYHTDPNCSGMKNAQVVTQAEAIARGQTACPTCVGSVYMTSNGKWYHSNSNCQGMSGAELVTVDAAIAAGKTACPECIGTSTTGDTTTDGTTTTTTTTDTSNVFYCTDKGTWYHSDKNCQGMTGAYTISAAAAEQKGKTACPVCLGGNSGVDNYYATSTGKWYHTDKNCQGMSGATRVSLATAVKRGQTACPVCAGGTEETTTPDVVTVDTNKTTTTTGTTTVTDGTYYSTVDGKYFHKNATCSGMKNADKVTAAQIAERGQTPCPKCVGTSGIYYSTEDGTYYHSKANCSGMKDADIVTLAMIRSRGQTACPKCIGSSTSGSTTTTDDDSTTYYYATANGDYYHKKSTCSGMKGATKITQAAAEAAGKSPCPSCVGSVYSAGGKYYHKDKNCDGMKNAKLVTILDAEKAGQTACPKCIGGTSTDTSGSTDTTDDDSDLAYYATEKGEYYHRTSTCSGMKGATKISESAAKKAGKTPCPKCIGTVYAVDGGDYYHKTATCSGMKNAKLMTVDQAELSGHAPCPTCMGGTVIEKDDSSSSSSSSGSSTKVDPDTTEVWVTIEGSKYHSEQYCSGMKNAAKTTLTWALEHNYKRCTECDAPEAD